MEDNEILEEETTTTPVDDTSGDNNEETPDTTPVEESNEDEPSTGTGDEPSNEGDDEGDGDDSGEGGDDSGEDSDDEGDGEDETPSEPIDLVKYLGIVEIPMNIPIEFLFVYNKLLMVMIELGESMLLDCNSLCNKKNMPIVECYHMFKTAVAAKQMSYNIDGNEETSNYYNKLANTLLKYVKEQLNCITRNYKDDLSFTLPIGANGLVNLFITKKDVNIEVIVEGSDIDIVEALIGIVRDILKGDVVTSTSTETYDLTEAELDAQQHWHVRSGYEFIEGSSEVHINGVKYFKDSETEDYRYEEWIVEEGGVRKGVGIKILTGNFDVGETPDEVHVEAKLLATNSHSN